MNDEAVYRTAPATPGLLTRHGKLGNYSESVMDVCIFLKCPMCNACTVLCVVKGTIIGSLMKSGNVVASVTE